MVVGVESAFTGAVLCVVWGFLAGTCLVEVEVILLEEVEATAVVLTTEGALLLEVEVKLDLTEVAGGLVETDVFELDDDTGLCDEVVGASYPVTEQPDLATMAAGQVTVSKSTLEKWWLA